MNFETLNGVLSYLWVKIERHGKQHCLPKLERHE